MIAKTAIEGLRASPLALALVVVNLMFLLAGLYILRELSASTRERETRRDELLASIVRDCTAERK